MKKHLKTLIVTSCLSLLISIPSFAGWQQNENSQWKYEQNGVMLTSQWLEDQGLWYYLDSNGIMLASTTQTIAGVSYSFAADGRWIEPAPVSVREGWSIYQNTEANYSIQYPSSMRADTSGSSDIDIRSDYCYVGLVHLNVPSYIDPDSVSESFRSIYAGTAYLNYQYQEDAQLSGYSFTKYRYSHVDGVTTMDLYFRYDSSNSILYGIAVGYVPHSQASTMEMVNTFRILP